MAHPTVRTGRALLAAGLVASTLSGCAIWPKALTWGSDDTPPPAPAAQPVTPPPVSDRWPPKSLPCPAQRLYPPAPQTRPPGAQPVMKSTP